MAEPRGPLRSPGFWLHHAALAWRRRVDAGLADLGLTHTQFDVLASASWLSRAGDAPTQQQVADLAGADRMMASKVVSGLEARGLLERRADPDNARVKRLTPTAEGRALVTRSVRIVAAIDESMFGVEGAARDRLSRRLQALAEP